VYWHFGFFICNDIVKSDKVLIAVDATTLCFESFFVRARLCLCWWCGVAVARCVRSTKLPYAGPS